MKQESGLFDKVRFAFHCPSPPGQAWAVRLLAGTPRPARVCCACEQSYPVLVPFVELADGRTVVATDGADSIEMTADGKSLRARWTKWAVVGTKSGELADVGLTSEVVWRIDNATITREETVSSNQAVSIKRWQLAVPSSYGQVQTEMSNGMRVDRFSAPAGTMAVQLSGMNFPVATSIVASRQRCAREGVRAIPLHLIFEARNLNLENGKPLKYQLSLAVTTVAPANAGSQASGSGVK